MEYLPGVEGVIEESLELCSLASMFFYSGERQGALVVKPSLEKAFAENGKRMIIEKLLSIAIKMRFLDDAYDFIKNNERGFCGQITVRSDTQEVGMREAFNKIIHAKSIKICAEPRRYIVSRDYGEESATEINIAEGRYESFAVFITTEGVNRRDEWVFNSELLYLSSEIIRIAYKGLAEG